MIARLLFGNDAPLPDAFGIAWVAIAGWTMGTTALGYLLHWRNGTLVLMLCGLVPGLLSGTAVRFSARGGRGIPMRAMLTMGSSTIAALVCGLLTPLAVGASGGNLGLGLGRAMAGAPVVAGVMMMVLLGVFFAVPLGLVFGTVYAIALSFFTAFQRRLPSRSDLDLALVGGGIGLVFVGIACLEALAGLPRMRPDATLAPQLTIGLGLIGALIGASRYMVRSSFIWRARRGAIAGWAVVPASDVADAESLPRLFAFGPTKTVLVRRKAADDGPFRSGEVSTPIARC